MSTRKHCKIAKRLKNLFKLTSPFYTRQITVAQRNIFFLFFLSYLLFFWLGIKIQNSFNSCCDINIRVLTRLCDILRLSWGKFCNLNSGDWKLLKLSNKIIIRLLLNFLSPSTKEMVLCREFYLVQTPTTFLLLTASIAMAFTIFWNNFLRELKWIILKQIATRDVDGDGEHLLWIMASECLWGNRKKKWVHLGEEIVCIQYLFKAEGRCLRWIMYFRGSSGKLGRRSLNKNT